MIAVTSFDGEGFLAGLVEGIELTTEASTA
jgi:hypothetical protein